MASDSADSPHLRAQDNRGVAGAGAGHPEGLPQVVLSCRQPEGNVGSDEMCDLIVDVVDGARQKEGGSPIGAQKDRVVEVAVVPR